MSAVYQANYGWNRQTTRVVAISAGFVAIAFLPTMPLWLSIVIWVFFGGGGLFFLVSTLRGSLALRVDGQGVTLGGLPMRRSTAAFVPWADIEAVVLFEQPVPMTGPMPYVGIKRRAGTGRLPGAMGSLSKALIPHVDGDVVAASRPINGWRLDRERLTAAVSAHAPQVPILEA